MTSFEDILVTAAGVPRPLQFLPPRFHPLQSRARSAVWSKVAAETRSRRHSTLTGFFSSMPFFLSRRLFLVKMLAVSLWRIFPISPFFPCEPHLSLSRSFPNIFPFRVPPLVKSRSPIEWDKGSELKMSCSLLHDPPFPFAIYPRRFSPVCSFFFFFPFFDKLLSLVLFHQYSIIRFPPGVLFRFTCFGSFFFSPLKKKPKTTDFFRTRSYLDSLLLLCRLSPLRWFAATELSRPSVYSFI